MVLQKRLHVADTDWRGMMARFLILPQGLMVRLVRFGSMMAVVLLFAQVEPVQANEIGRAHV